MRLHRIRFLNALLFCLIFIYSHLDYLCINLIVLHFYTWDLLKNKHLSLTSEPDSPLAFRTALHTERRCQRGLGESPRPRPNTSSPRSIFLTLRPQRQYQISQKFPIFFTILIFLFPHSNKRPREISSETTGNRQCTSRNNPGAETQRSIRRGHQFTGHGHIKHFKAWNTEEVNGHSQSQKLWGETKGKN